MIKKSRHYIVVVLSCLIAGILATYNLRAFDPGDGQWLCSGRYLAETGVTYDPVLITWLVIAAFGIAMAYFAIPSLIAKVIKLRNDITPEIEDVLRKFSMFIVMCGTGHLLDSFNLYLHWYYVAAGWHAATAIISIDTFIALRNHSGYFVNLPSRSFFDQYVKVSEELQIEYGTGFWWFDTVSGELKWSKGMYHIYGKPDNWKPNLKDIDALVDPTCKEHYERETSDHRSTQGGAHNFEYRIIVDGKVRHLKAIVNRDANGEIYGSILNLSKQEISISDYLHSVSKLEKHEDQMGDLNLALVRIEAAITSLKIKKL